MPKGFGNKILFSVQATLESSRKAAVPGKPTSEDVGGQLAFAQSAQATFKVGCSCT